MFEEKIMNQKVLVALTITAMILGVLNLTLLLIPYLQIDTLPLQSTLPNASQKIPLKVSNIVIMVTSEYYVIRVTVSLPNEIHTLFDCYVQADYLTENNVWKTTTENIGIVNYDEYIHPQLQLDADFNSGEPPIEPSNYWQAYERANVKVEAYGYLKP